MGRKVFMSFLGTNDYLDCNYYDESNPKLKVNNVRFIQEALIKLYCKDFGKGD